MSELPPSQPVNDNRLAAAYVPLIRFAVCVSFISFSLSLLLVPFIDLSWWRIFRRCVWIASIISLWLCIRKFEKRSFRSYGLTRAGKRQILLGIAFGFGALLLMLGVGVQCGFYHIELYADRAKFWRVLLGFLPAAVLISVLEESVFRGYILQHLLVSSRRWAIVVSSALYALVHLRSATFTLGTWLELGGLFLLGGVLALAYLQTGQLYLSMGLHAALAYGARVNKLIIGLPNPALAWFVGSNRLVNGLMTWIALLLLGGVVILWAKVFYRGGDRVHEA